jgi:hypothetical protein
MPQVRLSCIPHFFVEAFVTVVGILNMTGEKSVFPSTEAVKTLAGPVRQEAIARFFVKAC